MLRKLFIYQIATEVREKICIFWSIIQELCIFIPTLGEWLDQMLDETSNFPVKQMLHLVQDQPPKIYRSSNKM